MADKREELQKIRQELQAVKESVVSLEQRDLETSREVADDVFQEIWKELDVGCKLFKTGTVAKWFNCVKALTKELSGVEPEYHTILNTNKNTYSVDIETVRGQFFRSLLEKMGPDSSMAMIMKFIWQKSVDNPFIDEEVK